VFLIDIVEAAAEETRKKIEAEGNVCALHLCNMLKAAEVERMVQACVDRFKRIDILVNNVGGSEPGNPVTMPEEAWDRQIDFNIKTVFLGCKYVLPLMEAQGKGAIVNISSVAGLRNSQDRTHVGYSSSKAAVIQFTRSTAGAYAKKGVRCNTVVPGLMHTPLVEHRLAKQLSFADVQSLIAKRNAQVPMGRMGTAWDVAHAVLFLASDEAGYITGTEIIVDGGYIAFGAGGA
jgi:NAD(P)-dependent dehydrogenase (short-subunit alcohol dehydrogenase family)